MAMAWLEALWPSEWLQHNSNVLITAAVILAPALIFLLYRKYSEWNTYEKVEDNEILKAKLEAARLKQQEKYDQFIKENGDALSEANKKLEQELKTDSDHGKNPKPHGGDSLHTDRDYFPLMGGGTGNSYRPAKKRACGPCGGGGCG